MDPTIWPFTSYSKGIEPRRLFGEQRTSLQPPFQGNATRMSSRPEESHRRALPKPRPWCPGSFRPLPATVTKIFPPSARVTKAKLLRMLARGYKARTERTKAERIWQLPKCPRPHPSFALCPTIHSGMLVYPNEFAQDELSGGQFLFKSARQTRAFQSCYGSNEDLSRHLQAADKGRSVTVA
jgi:hypothetical protein